MSSDSYFKLWLRTVNHLERLLECDLNYQETKTHDQTQCDAVKRLSGMLGEYLVVYQELTEATQMNLQVQKTWYMKQILEAVTERIIELKHQLRALESMYHHFIGSGLISHLITPFNVEINDVPTTIERTEEIKLAIKNAFKAVAERKEKIAKIAEEEAKIELEAALEQAVDNWWDETVDEKHKKESFHLTDIYKVENKESKETMHKRALIALIQAHERTRQVTSQRLLQKQRRELWQKELEGTLKPPARLEIRERSAKLIQTILRKYFEIKRKRIVDCKRDECIGLRLCKKQTDDQQVQVKQIRERRIKLIKKYDEDWKSHCEVAKQKFYDRHKDHIAEDYRDFMHGWFKRWFDEVNYLLNIPKPIKGGIEAVINDAVPSPSEWTELYQEHLEQKRSNKKKSALQLKYEKIEAEREKAQKKKEEQMKKKQEEILMKKIMKNPKAHPGFYYPQSKTTEKITQMLEKYHEHWDEFDEEGKKHTKERHVKIKDIGNMCLEVKKEVLQEVDEVVRADFKVLKKALKKDYQTNGEEMPESIEKREKKPKKEKKHKPLAITDEVTRALEELVEKEILKETEETRIQDFQGDVNFAGDDLRCAVQAAPVFRGDLRGVWWERCREVQRGPQRVLLVGPRGSGRVVLVQAMASINDATYLNVNPYDFQDKSVSPADIRHLAHTLLIVARATQPTVILIRDVEKLYYRKVPPGEISLNSKSLKKNLIRFLSKKIQKNDHITIVGTCSDPWMTRTKELLKQFPNINLVPNTSYTTVVELLNNWVLENRTIPRNLDVNSLANLLKGYQYQFLKDALRLFLSAERLVKIAVFGLKPIEIYEFIVELEVDDKIDYTKYQDWYNKTSWGVKEAKKTQEQKEFKAAMDLYAERAMKKKIKSVKSSTVNSV